MRLASREMPVRERIRCLLRCFFSASDEAIPRVKQTSGKRPFVFNFPIFWVDRAALQELETFQFFG